MKISRYLSLFLTAFLLSGSVQEASAQKWLKKLGKGVGQVLDAAVEVTDALTNGVSIPGFEVEVGECQHWGTGAALRMTVTNTTNKDRELVFRNQFDAGNAPVAYLADGSKHDVQTIIGNTTNDWAVVPAGVKVKVTFFVYDVDPECSLIKTLDIHGRYKLVGTSYGGSNVTGFSGKLSNIPVTKVQNSNADNVECTWPSMQINFKSLTRQGSDVVLDFTLTNVSGKDVDRGCDNLRVYDTEGNTYDAEAYYGNTNVSGFSKGTFVNEIPLRCRVVVKDVPASVTKLSLIQFDLSQGYSVKVRNQAIAAQ